MRHVSKIVSIMLSKLSDCPNTDTSLCYYPFWTASVKEFLSDVQCQPYCPALEVHYGRISHSLSTCRKLHREDNSTIVWYPEGNKHTWLEKVHICEFLQSFTKKWRIPVYASWVSSHKPIRIYTGGLILGVNTLYRLFCFFKLFPMVGKGLNPCNVYCLLIGIP